MTNTKSLIWESEAKLKTLQKLSHYIGVSYKLVSESVKRLNRVFWKIEYWFIALECQIWSTNTKPFFWESEAKLETLQKLSASIGVTYKFVLKCLKSRNRIFLDIKYWFKTLECLSWSTNTKPFSGKARQSFKLSRNFLPILQFSINLFWSLSKT